jgi:phage gpG-like protein
LAYVVLGEGAMKKFSSIAAFVKHMEGNLLRADAARSIGLRDASHFLAVRTADALGTYQRANVGPFTPWAELADSTKERRVKHGYTENDPLYASGTLKFSIESATDNLRTAVVGTNDEKAEWLEMGTPKMPPRPFFGLTAWRYREQVAAMMVLPLVMTLAGARVGNKPIMSSPYADTGVDDIPF